MTSDPEYSWQSYSAQNTAAVSKPQLNINAHMLDPNFYKGISKIMRLRQSYIKDRSIFIEGRVMASILKHLGARDDDFRALQDVNDINIGDPTLPFRKSRNGRFCFDLNTRSVRRLEFQPFALSAEEDFVRHDSDMIRVFDEIGNDIQLNTVFQALLVFKAIMFHGVMTKMRPRLDYGQHKWVCTLFALRTVTTPALLGEPALEGVHTDGVDHTMTTFLKSDNMAPNSAATFLHDMRETTGIRLNESKPELIRGNAQHRHFLDTILIVDHELKHSLSPVYAVDSAREAYRDMLIFFTRKPVTESHISAGIDSLRPHKGMPMEVPLFV
ncbi:2OG-Fe dioxygenase family protein [Aspergillus udagawae]|uniref:2OG-Fe dioxygenase-domain-containing protein n=1 Tax=Aspergillus udagawae TaxID=91492 RepID=A0A8E0QJU5_9EURO|nr:uncharacterized protein Aud_000070 [Aspergillus udagawae]GIC84256.1 hypothetical protein Aud_000070 [Aspergillus udagawae]